MNSDEKNLSEKYRPTDISQVVGQNHITDVLKDKEKLNHMMFLGPPGCGKTTVAHILAKLHNIPIVEINASDDRGIGMIRDKVKKIAYRKTKKIILLDEGDSMSRDAQPALRRIMEKSPSIFILTGNYGYKFIKPIKSRCSIYNFKPLSEKQIFQRIVYICKSENIDIEKSDETKEAIKTLVSNSGGDMRKAINILEKVILKGKITRTSVLSLLKPNHAAESLQSALDGDLETAQRLLENDFKSRGFDADDMIKDIYECIKDISDKDIRARLYYKLSQTASACQVSGSPILPLIHLIGLLSYAWILPHLTKCPMLNMDSDLNE